MKIFPIHLSDYRAESLVRKYARNEFDEESRFQSSRTQYSYSATLSENGEVKLHVHYSFDDGFCMGSGSLLNKTIQPYSAEEVETLKREKMMQLAACIYEQEQNAKHKAAILKIAKKMFKDQI